MNVSSSYIKKCIYELEKLTEKDRPYTRLVFSKEFKEARNWLTNQFKNLDLDIKIDNAGNLIGIYKSFNKSSFCWYKNRLFIILNFLFSYSNSFILRF